MRIAVLNWSNRRFGGTGSYLSTVLPRLQRTGHDVALWHEVDAPQDYPFIAAASNVPSWSVERLGLEQALDVLRSWHPDVLYGHGFVDVDVEARTLDVAPAVFFPHSHYGTCISGAKTTRYPDVRPCARRFGPACLAHYFPRRCGGGNPVTMVRMFRQQRDRLSLLRRYQAIVVHSAYLRDEYIRHGLREDRVFNVKYGSDGSANGLCQSTDRADDAGRPWRLLFAGRMDRLKGGEELIRAAPEVAVELGRRIHVTLAGDGPARRRWEALAEAACRQSHECVEYQFQGWVGGDAVEGLLARADLLVVPSLCPETLGLVGLEAARHHLPAAAFAVGGIADWLRHGVNGMLAPADPPTVRGLVNAICGCLATPAVHARLRAGAAFALSEFTMDAHMSHLMPVLQQVAACG